MEKLYIILAAIIALVSGILGATISRRNDGVGNTGRIKRKFKDQEKLIKSERTELKRERKQIESERDGLKRERDILDRDTQLLDELRRRQQEKTEE